VTGLLAYQCLFGGWLILLWRVGYFRGGRLRAYGRIWWVSYLYRYVPSKLLLLVERARMGAAVGIPPASGAALAVLETVLSICAASWVSLLAASYYAGNERWLLAAVAVLSVAILLLLPVGYRWLCAQPVVTKRYPELTPLALRPMDMVLVIPPFVLHFLLLGASFFLLLRNLHPLPRSALPGLCGVYALAHVVGLVTMIAPGGLGVREATLSLQLSRVLAPGPAAAVALGARIWFTLAELLSLGVVLLLSPRQPELEIHHTDSVAPKG
jgi:hypothetical protein